MNENWAAVVGLTPFNRWDNLMEVATEFQQRTGRRRDIISMDWRRIG